MAVLEMKWGGVTGPKFLRYSVYGSYGISVVFINKKLDKQSWHCSINPGSNMCTTPCTPPYGVNFFSTQTEYFSVKSLSVATLGHSILIEYIKSTQGHMLRSIPVVHSGNSAHSGPFRQTNAPIERLWCSMAVSLC